jgi:hypothetical protein
MATSVKLSEMDKRKLEKLQALVTVKTSKKVTQQEILSRLITKATEEVDAFVYETFQRTVSMPDDMYGRWLSLTSDWGVRTRWDEIDKIVYGSTRSRRDRKQD